MEVDDNGPESLLEAKKAHMEPSVFVEGSVTQRVPLVPYDEVPAGDDQRMDKYPDFKVSLSITGPTTLVAAKVGPPKLAVAKAGPSRSTTAKAGTAKPATTPVVAANPVVIATPVAFPNDVMQGSEVGMIEVLKPMTYMIPFALSDKYFPPVH
ncbi:hypothetical protein C0989_004766 [Termitomyces sp. Mn162]|nr:hypothetical protein C0989_004766 [Termitomyces sp. Mn162]